MFSDEIYDTDEPKKEKRLERKSVLDENVDTEVAKAAGKAKEHPELDIKDPFLWKPNGKGLETDPLKKRGDGWSCLQCQAKSSDNHKSAKELRDSYLEHIRQNFLYTLPRYSGHQKFSKLILILFIDDNSIFF